jgi:hypothetical protein
MKTIIDPMDHESILAQWRGAQAQIWTFHVSLKRMAIKLIRKGETEAIFIVAVACEHISGPFSWKEAGFELRCAGVALASGPTGVLPNPFENFIGHAPSM